jgi:replicative DNA helicase
MKRLPHDPSAELALCGAALVDGGVLDAIDVQDEHFFDPRLRRLWGHMQGLRARGVAIDEVTLLDGAPAGVDVVLISEVAAKGGNSRNAGHYAETVRRHALTRQVLTTLADLTTRAGDGRVDGKDLLDEALAAITRIDVGRPGTTRNIGDLIKLRLVELDAINAARSRGEEWLSGITTGLPKLDAETSGWPLGMLSIVAARPGMGKSAFMLSCTRAAAAAGHGVHVFSFEDARSMYTDRAMSQASGVPGAAIRGTMEMRHREQLIHGVKSLYALKRWLYEDVSALTAEDIVRAVRRARAENNTKLVVIDYLQRVRRPKRYESVHDSIFQTLSTLADAARHDNIAYVVASQLNRGVEKRPDKRPTLPDLRESGSIEELCKLIIGLYRGSYYGDPQKGIDYDPVSNDPRERFEPNDHEWKRRLDLWLLKHSQGEANGFVRCDFDGPTMQIREAA